ncbi:hypothetical protein TcYC6_0015230 [Trypanosoma cruzi]|nr:hypothetical protein TcYC6_0015230 [Trypanosoma cruzi]
MSFTTRRCSTPLLAPQLLSCAAVVYTFAGVGREAQGIDCADSPVVVRYFADARAVVVGEESTCSPFLPTSRSVLSVWIIIDAERAADVEFAKLFLMEVVCACVDGVFRGLMRTRCRRRMFRVCVFLARTAVGADAVVRLASSEGTGCCGVSTVAVEVAVSLSAPSLFRLRHGALRRERRLHDAASRYLGPGVYLDSRWRSPEVADRVWRAMAPKGFATMCVV